jgi:hypothetical protein
MPIARRVEKDDDWMKDTDDTRQVRGRQKSRASFPVAGKQSHLPVDYQTTLADLKQRISRERLRVTLSANANVHNVQKRAAVAPCA